MAVFTAFTCSVILRWMAEKDYPDVPSLPLIHEIHYLSSYSRLEFGILSKKLDDFHWSDLLNIKSRVSISSGKQDTVS